jgi:signal transduction histidine kinase/ActR/RegA family two-component response regulator
LEHDPVAARDAFEAEVAGRFGLLPNFFRSAAAAPELIQRLWGFAKAGYLDNPMPSVFKERLFVWLSRFCPTRYCIVRHVGFLLGDEHGRASGDSAAAPQTVVQVIDLLRCPSPWQRDMSQAYELLEGSTTPIGTWPDTGTDMEDALFACAALMFVEPARSDRARRAVARALGPRNLEFFCGCLAFIRTAHYWTMLHPEIDTEDDMQQLMRGHEELARLLLDDPEADRCEMGQRLFAELSALRDLNERRDLERAKRALEEKDRQKDEFIAVLAHELRNPLSAIRAATDTLAIIEGHDPRAILLVERLDRQTSAMARLLDDLLDASRIALGKVSVQLEQVDLPELLASVVEEHRPRARDAELELIAQAAGAPCFVKADRIRLRQILDNLLSNAVKFTPARGRIEVAFVTEGDHAAITVQDSGVGFDEHFADKLFEPFTQQDRTRDRAAGGLGLGLAIASSLAALQGGSISAASAGIDKGALFALRIPIVDPSEETKTAATPISTLGRHSILLVEDNMDAADSLAELLGLSGCQVTVAHDGAEALRSALQVVPDLILCDLGLPGKMDGFDVARACRAESSLRSVRLVAMSGYSSAEDHAQAQSAGFECLLTKPFNLDSLAEITQGPRLDAGSHP